MITVMRFIAPDDAGEEEIYRIGEVLNALVAGSFNRPDKVGGRFSIIVATDGEWRGHDAKLVAYLDQVQPAIRVAAESGFSMECDALVEAEDVDGVAYLNVTPTPDLMRRLVSAEIVFNLTVQGR